MDEEDVLRVGMDLALRPITDIAADALGLAGGDWLHERRERNRARLQEKTGEILRERNIKPHDASPTILLPLLSAAQNESREELLDLWAKLLAAAVDPARGGSVRREFIEAVRQMEPLDAVVLEEWGPTDNTPDRTFSDHRRNSDKVLISLQHLHRLGCVTNVGRPEMSYAPNAHTQITPFGRELLGMLRESPK